MVEEDWMLLSLAINPSNSLIVILKVPGNPEPNNVVTSLLEIKPVAHRSGVSKKHWDVSSVEVFNDSSAF
jgi:hypothetical protein